jgi:hypothetical protein
VYYIEFVEPKQNVPQQQFQEVVKASNERWAAAHPDDELVLLIGRTWRLGPRPAYLTIWRIKDASTLTRWTREFQEPEIMGNHLQFRDVATIVDAGLYEDLGEEVW